jgi:hypothetical protein
MTAIGLLALLAAAPAAAQTQSASGETGSSAMGIPGFNLGGSEEVDPATAEKRKEIEDAYRRVTKSQPAQAAATNDPWANMRSADEAKPAAKPAAKPVARTAQKKKPAQ